MSDGFTAHRLVHRCISCPLTGREQLPSYWRCVAVSNGQGTHGCWEQGRGYHRLYVLHSLRRLCRPWSQAGDLVQHPRNPVRETVSSFGIPKHRAPPVHLHRLHCALSQLRSRVVVSDSESFANITGRRGVMCCNYPLLKSVLPPPEAPIN